MYKMYYVEKVNAAGDTFEEYAETKTALERDALIKELKQNPFIIEIGYYREYKNHDIGILKTVYKTA